MKTLKPIPASAITPEVGPSCPECHQLMPYYEGAFGFICCDTKILHRAGGWIDDQGRHVTDQRLNNNLTGGVQLL